MKIIYSSFIPMKRLDYFLHNISIYSIINIQVQVPASSDTCTVYICLLELF